MKLFKTFLAMPLVALLSLSLWSCNPNELGPSFGVEFQNTVVDVVFGESGTVNYTYTGDAKSLTIRMSATPEDGYCSFENNYSGGKGTVTVTPLKNEDHECEYTLTFTCDSHKLNQKIKVRVTKLVTENLVVNLAAESVTVPVGKTATLGFTYTGNDGQLTAALKETTDVFALASDANDGTGTLTFTSLKEDEYTGEHTVIFTSGQKTVEKKIAVIVDRQENAPKAVLEKGAYALYVGENSIAYVIEGGKPTEVTVNAPEGVTATVEEAADRMSGEIRLVVAEGFPTESRILTITTSNEHGSNDCTVNIARAYISLSTAKATIPQEGLDNEDWIIRTNVDECVLELEDCEEFVKAEIGVDEYSGSPCLKYSATANPSDWKRWGQITIEDKDHPEVNHKLVVMQNGSPTSLEKDREALCVLWEAMDGPNWNHTYGFEGTDSYKWCTDAPLEEWGGNFGFHQRNVGQRPYRLCGSNQQGWKGELPVEFGWLDCLEEIQLYTHGVTGTIPNSICNLHKLKELDWSDAVSGFNGRLEDMEGLKTLIKYGALRGCYIYNQMLEGPIPEWIEYLLNKYPDDFKGTMMEFRRNHLSGQVPDNIANHKLWTRRLEFIFDKKEGLGQISVFMSYGEYQMYQRDDYALWVGEKPANVIQVDGHWEWLPGTNPYKIEGIREE